MEYQTCPTCGQTMERGSNPLTLSYKGFSATFDMPGWYCSACGESVHTGKDMQVSDRHLNTLKAQAEDLLIPAEVKRIRRKLGLTQDMAGRILGGGPNAFHKYESGTVLPSQAISNLLRVLEASPESLTVLRRQETHIASEKSRSRISTLSLTGVRPRGRQKEVVA